MKQLIVGLCFIAEFAFSAAEPVLINLHQDPSTVVTNYNQVVITPSSVAYQVPSGKILLIETISGNTTDAEFEIIIGETRHPFRAVPVPSHFSNGSSMGMNVGYVSFANPIKLPSLSVIECSFLGGTQSYSPYTLKKITLFCTLIDASDFGIIPASSILFSILSSGK